VLQASVTYQLTRIGYFYPNCGESATHLASHAQIAALITEVLAKPDDAALQASVKQKVRALTAKFPLPY
jgi:glycine/serine hydroxymethyltransferase